MQVSLMMALLVLLLAVGDMEIPARAPDGRRLLQICSEESAIVHLVWNAERLGAYTLLDLHSGAVLLPPLAVVTYAPGEDDPDITHTYFRGRDWTNEEFTTAFPEPCSLIQREERA
jgi:hypothetical protein